jgi:hypothetical protein
MPGVTLHRGDCLDVLATLPADAVDAIVADPPAGIAFMSKAFDDPRTYPSDKARLRDRFLDFLTPRLAACLRVARPGARMLCWAIPRTSHWTGTAIEDAGWIIEERLAHVFGQGFPKAKSKLKPAVEDWWLARKPGGKVPDLNIDACRVEMKAGDKKGGFGPHPGGLGEETTPNGIYGAGFQRADYDQSRGRYPPNLLLSHHAGCRPVGTTRVKGSMGRRGKGRLFAGLNAQPEIGLVGYADADGLETVAAWACVAGCPVRALDAMSGERPNNYRPNPTVCQARVNQVAKGDEKVRIRGVRGHNDSGGASRFYPQFTPADDLDFPGLYCPKASRADRGAGNTHPTVKSQTLVRWLCRLICPPGGTVLDPFLGSGTTLLACLAEGFGGIGIESDPESFALAEQRLAAARAARPLLSGAV